MSGKRNASVADFPPEFFDLWALAAKRTLRIEFPKRGQAINFKQRMYTFRKRLSEENPALAEAMLNVDLRVIGSTKDGEAGVLESYIPEWKQVAHQARDSGLSALPVESLPESALNKVPGLGETLSDLGFSTDKPKD